MGGRGAQKRWDTIQMHPSPQTVSAPSRRWETAARRAPTGSQHQGAGSRVGVPAVLRAWAERRKAVLTPAPTQATYPTWAHFMFPRAYHRKQAVTLSEDVTLVRRALSSLRPAPDSRPWRWEF